MCACRSMLRRENEGAGARTGLFRGPVFANSERLEHEGRERDLGYFAEAHPTFMWGRAAHGPRELRRASLDHTGILERMGGERGPWRPRTRGEIGNACIIELTWGRIAERHD